MYRGASRREHERLQYPADRPASLSHRAISVQAFGQRAALNVIACSRRRRIDHEENGWRLEGLERLNIGAFGNVSGTRRRRGGEHGGGGRGRFFFFFSSTLIL